MRRYLRSSIEKVERLEALIEKSGFNRNGFLDRAMRDICAAANVPIAPDANAANDWLRGLSHAEADSLIKLLTEWTEKR